MREKLIHETFPPIDTRAESNVKSHLSDPCSEHIPHMLYQCKRNRPCLHREGGACLWHSLVNSPKARCIQGGDVQWEGGGGTAQPQNTETLPKKKKLETSQKVVRQIQLNLIHHFIVAFFCFHLFSELSRICLSLLRSTDGTAAIYSCNYNCSWTCLIILHLC